MDSVKQRLGQLALILAAACAGGPLLAQDADHCAALADFDVPGVDVSISQAVWAEEREAVVPPAAPPLPPLRLPPHCHVEGYFDRRTGVNGEEYAIRFALNLPDQWNGRFLFQGGAGANGVVMEPGLQLRLFGSMPLHDGFAVVSTDTGHVRKPDAPELYFLEDQAAAMDFFYIANLKVDRIAREVVEGYYAAEIDRAYFAGGSNGGREGLLMAQRYPERFDGIVVIAPGIRLGVVNLAHRYIGAAFNRALAAEGGAPPSARSIFSSAERQAVADAVRARCDGLDGLEDGLIFNTSACDFDPRNVACPTAGAGVCLSAAKVEALAAAFRPIETSTGIVAHPGFMLDTGIDDVGGLLTEPVQVFGQGPVTALEVDVEAEYIAALTDDFALSDAAAVNLSTFASRGGKLMILHGNSDPIVSALDTVAWYERMSAANGGMPAVRTWSRLFLVPGMLHGPFGETTVHQVDTLSLIVDWVENGAAPDRVIATGPSMPGVSRPLCPYPGYAYYVGTGDEADAASFECRIAGSQSLR